MQLINKKNYFSIVCVVYTFISLGKIIVESIQGHSDPYYAENFITIFLISLIATLILSLHYYLQSVPLTIVIPGQYLFILGIILSGIWIEGHFTKLAATAYQDMFWSFTIPYAIGAMIYYASFMLQMRKANKLLEEIKKNGGKRNEY